MSKTAIIDKRVAFSRIFQEKKSLAVYFPETLDLNFQLVQEIISWVPPFQSLLLIFPEYQRNFYKALVTDQRVRIEALEEYTPSSNQDLVLILTKERQIQKGAEGHSATATLGFGNRVNVRFVPPEDNPLQLCRKVAELLQVSTCAAGEKIPYPVEDKELFSRESGRRKYLFDIHNPLVKIILKRQLKKMSPPFECLFVNTRRPLRRIDLYQVDSEPRSPKRYPLKLDLYEIIKHAGQSRQIVTDNRSFYLLLQNFPLQKRTIFSAKFLTGEKIVDLLP